MTSARAEALKAWPASRAGTGPALTKRQVAELIDRSLSAVEQAIRRARAGQGAFPFPDPDGWAVPNGAKREQMVPYWYTRTIVGWGCQTGRLNKDGTVIKDSYDKPE